MKEQHVPGKGLIEKQRKRIGTLQMTKKKNRLYTKNSGYCNVKTWSCAANNGFRPALCSSWKFRERYLNMKNHEPQVLITIGHSTRGVIKIIGTKKQIVIKPYGKFNRTYDVSSKKGSIAATRLMTCISKVNEDELVNECWLIKKRNSGGECVPFSTEARRFSRTKHPFAREPWKMSIICNQSKDHIARTLPRRFETPWPPDLARSCTDAEEPDVSKTSWVAAAWARLIKYARGAVFIKDPLETALSTKALNIRLPKFSNSSFKRIEWDVSLPLSCNCSAASQTVARSFSEQHSVRCKYQFLRYS